MAAPRSLGSAEAAKQTLAHRLTRRADRLRQLNTRFGLRSKRVFLVWTQWTGVARGEGDEVVFARVELLPTPRVSDLSAVSKVPTVHGTFQDGTIRVDQVSCGAYTEDNLTGLRVPDVGAELNAPRPTMGSPIVLGTDRRVDVTNARIDFFFELIEDGRGDAIEGDPQSSRKRFRLLGVPNRAEGSLYWSLNLQRASDDLDRTGNTRVDDEDLSD